jgi:hypothetical protein
MTARRLMDRGTGVRAHQGRRNALVHAICAATLACQNYRVRRDAGTSPKPAARNAAQLAELREVFGAQW